MGVWGDVVNTVKGLAPVIGTAVGATFGGPGGAAAGNALGNVVAGTGGNAAGAIMQGYDLYRSKEDRKKYLKKLDEASRIEKESFNKLSAKTREGFTKSLTYGKKARDSRVRNTDKGYDAANEGLRRGKDSVINSGKSGRNAQIKQTSAGYGGAINTQIQGRRSSDAKFDRDRQKFTNDEKSAQNYLLIKERQNKKVLQDGAKKSSSYYDPYVASGKKTTDLMTSLLTDPTANADKYLQTADFKFAFDQGNQALDRSAAARGGLLSGASMKAAQKFGTGLAHQNYNNFINQLASASAQGLNATGAVSKIEQDLANALVANATDYSKQQIDNDQFYNNLFSGNTAQQNSINQNYDNAVANARINQGNALSDIEKNFYDTVGKANSTYHTGVGDNQLKRYTTYGDIDGKYYDDVGQSYLDYNQRQGQIGMNQDATVANNMRADGREYHQNDQANQRAVSGLINTAVGGTSGANDLVGSIINAGQSLLSGGGGAPATTPGFANPFNFALG